MNSYPHAHTRRPTGETHRAGTTQPRTTTKRDEIRFQQTPTTISVRRNVGPVDAALRRSAYSFLSSSMLGSALKRRSDDLPTLCERLRSRPQIGIVVHSPKRFERSNKPQLQAAQRLMGAVCEIEEFVTGDGNRIDVVGRLSTSRAEDHRHRQVVDELGVV